MEQWSVQFLVDLGLRIWQHSGLAGAFFAGLSCALILRFQANRMISEARRQHLAELREQKEQILLELKLLQQLQLNGHAHDGDESGLGSV